MSSLPPLDQWAWDLLQEALDLYRDHPAVTDQLRHHAGRFQEPLRVAVAGPWQAGKSTLLSALVGEEVAPIGVAPAGCEVFTWYQDGAAPQAVAYPPGHELAVSRSAQGIVVDSSGWQPAEVNDIVVTWPARTLRHATLVDTPAMPSGEGEEPPVAAAGKILQEADAVLYLTRDARGADLRFLDCTVSGTVARAAPVNLLLVLSRADEVAGGRVDALLSARQLGRRAHREPRVRSRCLATVAVSGRVALAGRVLSEPDFAALAALTGLPRDQLASLVLSTDRFTDPAAAVPVPVSARQGLLERLGIFGVRLATTLIRTGSDTRAKLAGELVSRAGLSELRAMMARCFIDRQEVIKARSALAALESVLHREPRPGVPALLGKLDRLLANAHEFRELRLLAALQAQRLSFEAEVAAEANRLIGGEGTTAAARLGLEHEASAEQLWQVTGEALARWQEHSTDPQFDLEQQRAAQVVVRSCEQIAAQLA